MWYVYIIRSLVNPFLYVGSTNDLQRRFDEHQAGQTQSTAPYRPFQLEGYIAVCSKEKARSLERYFKTGSGKAILKKRILNDEDLTEHIVQSEA